MLLVCEGCKQCKLFKYYFRPWFRYINTSAVSVGFAYKPTVREGLTVRVMVSL